MDNKLPQKTIQKFTSTASSRAGLQNKFIEENDKEMQALDDLMTENQIKLRNLRLELLLKDAQDKLKEASKNISSLLITQTKQENEIRDLLKRHEEKVTNLKSLVTDTENRLNINLDKLAKEAKISRTFKTATILDGQLQNYEEKNIKYLENIRSGWDRLNQINKNDCVVERMSENICGNGETSTDLLNSLEKNINLKQELAKARSEFNTVMSTYYQDVWAYDNIITNIMKKCEEQNKTLELGLS